MPIPLGPPGGWGSFAQALGPSQDPGYASSTSGGAGPSTGPFVTTTTTMMLSDNGIMMWW